MNEFINLPEILPLDQKDQVGPVYLVGGSVRDHLLGRPINDYDFVVQGDAGAFAEKMARKLGGTFFTIGTGQKANHRIVSGKNTFDFTSMVGETIEDDLRRRDFTINALGYALRTGRLIDPLNGRDDLDGRLVRLAAEDALVADPLRMLRAFRFSAVLGFKITPETLENVKKETDRIVHVAGERIRSELFQIMGLEDSFSTIQQMVRTGLLTKIIPELDATRVCGQNDIHGKDVFDHTMEVYAGLEKVFVTFGEIWPRFSAVIEEYVSTDRHRTLLKWAALFHDLGKPVYRRSDEHGKVTFRGHEKESARQSLAICARLKMSNHDSLFISRMVEEHLKPLLLFTAKRRGELTSRGVVRFARKNQEHIIGLMMHGLADQQAKGGVEEAVVKEFTRFADEVLNTYFVEMKPKMRLPRLLTGNDLMAFFDLKPSELVGRILKKIEEAQLAGEISTREEALDTADKLIGMEGDAGIEPATPSSGG